MSTMADGARRTACGLRGRLYRRLRVLAAVPMLAVVWVPGCQFGGPQAGATTVVTTNRATPIKLEGFNTDNTPVSFSLAGTDVKPANGSVSLSGRIATYTPRAGWRGTDSFGFTVTAADGVRKASALVTVIVKRPNIVVVMADDQRADQQRFLTRTNELIGAAGTTFSDMIVSYSECCPSRATLLTGQYAHNHGVLSSGLPTGGVTKLRDADTLATRLQAAGYFTALSGKYLNDYGDLAKTPAVPGTYVPPGWSDWLGFVEPDSYNFYDYDISDNGRIVHRGTAVEDYSTDVVFARAERNIRTRGGGATPLFLFVTPTAPHNIWGGPGRPPVPIPAERHKGRFLGMPAPRNPATDLTDVSTLPPWIAGLPPITNWAGLDNMWRIGAESLLAVDEGVERLVTALKETGELDNTLFVYTSDNGQHYGDHRMMFGKSDQYEETLRVPLLIRGPGFPAGVTARQPVANIDLYPTLTTAADIPPGRGPDGVPLGRFARGPGYGTTRPVVIENGPLQGRRTFQGIRDGRWTYVETRYGQPEPYVELYDRLLDPYETVNRATFTDEASRLGRFYSWINLNDLRACAGAACHRGV